MIPNLRLFTPDNKDHILIALETSEHYITLPINPDELVIEGERNNKIVDIIGIGEVNVPGSMKLRKLKIKSFLWAKEPVMGFGLNSLNFYGILGDLNKEAREVVKRRVNQDFMSIQGLANSKEKVRFTASGMNIDMDVIVDRFAEVYKAGEEDDRYYELDLTEYRDYGARRIS